MIPRIPQRPARSGAFRPVMLIETVPWLMLAAALRVVVWHRGLAAFPAEIAANAAIFIALLLCARTLAPSLYFGFDGIAFDSNIGRLWSAVVATIILLTVVRYEHGQRPSMLGALREFASRWKYLLAGIVAAALFQILLSPVQGIVRWWVYLFWTGTAAPEVLKAIFYFTFIFGFATIRLWGTVVILILALRESYRRAGPVPAAGSS
jgi:hypothetical protein